MHIIALAGTGSGSGKTTLAEVLLGKLDGFAAIKVSVGGMYASVTDDDEVIMEPGKDTHVMREAGAYPVVLVRCPYEEISDALDQAFVLVGNAHGVLVEGNSGSARLKPDVAFFVTGTDPGELKKSAHEALARADVVVVNVEDSEPPYDTVEAVRKHNRLAAVTTMGAVRAGAPPLDELVRKLSAD